jgi:hypothetical protein
VSNSPLDHALYPEHDPKLVVAGVMGHSEKEGVICFQVKSVILGNNSFQGQSLKITARSFLWPTGLVSSEEGTSCILVLRPWDVKGDEEWYLYTVVPGRKKDYPRARDSLAARAVLADELLAQLETEKSKNRQRWLLQQLTPVLARENANAVKGFLKSRDPWVRRSALAALVYATEEGKYLEALARDVQSYFAKTKDVKWVDGLDPGVRMHPKTLLLEHYFFLDRTTWTWGTRWDEREADKHLRILNGMLDKGIIEEWVRKELVGE